MVLDVSNGVVVSPVNGVGLGSLHELEGVDSLLGSQVSSVAQELLVFVFGPVAQGGDAEGVGVAFSVVLLDLVVVFLEDGQSEVVFFFGSVRSLVVGDEVDEFSLNVRDGASLEESGAAEGRLVDVHVSESGNSSRDGESRENLLGIVNYSAFVVLEDRLVGFNGDGDGCVGAGGLQSARAVRGNILIATVFEVI